MGDTPNSSGDRTEQTNAFLSINVQDVAAVKDHKAWPIQVLIFGKNMEEWAADVIRGIYAYIQLTL